MQTKNVTVLGKKIKGNDREEGRKKDEGTLKITVIKRKKSIIKNVRAWNPVKRPVRMV